MLTWYCLFLYCSSASLITVDAIEYYAAAGSHKWDTDQPNSVKKHLIPSVDILMYRI